MVMTNYMELLAVNQPWNLILFMVIPVGLAEALVATEFFAVFLQDKKNSAWHSWNRYLGIAVGFYFTGVFLYLVTQVVPSIQWRGYADVIAVGAYLLGVVPLLSIALLELGVFGKNLTQRDRMKRHFILLIGFLVVSHIAMIFGMVNPQITGWKPANTMEEMTNHSGQMMDMEHKMPEGHKMNQQ